MNLNETTFNEFLNWLDNNNRRREYVKNGHLRIIYDHMKAKGLTCEGRNLTVRYNGEWQSSFSTPLEYEPKREDFIWDLFHEVWCKTEWAVRCTRTTQELGYESVKATFGTKIIKALQEVA